MGVVFADHDNDFDADLFVTNFVHESNTLYRNDGNGAFSDQTVAAGIEMPTLPLSVSERSCSTLTTTATPTFSSPTVISWPTSGAGTT